LEFMGGRPKFINGRTGTFAPTIMPLYVLRDVQSSDPSAGLARWAGLAGNLQYNIDNANERQYNNKYRLAPPVRTGGADEERKEQIYYMGKKQRNFDGQFEK